MKPEAEVFFVIRMYVQSIQCLSEICNSKAGLSIRNICINYNKPKEGNQENKNITLLIKLVSINFFFGTLLTCNKYYIYIFLI